jgi:CheY-like chemotaxis protein
VPNVRDRKLARILLVEDSDARSETLRSWIPANIRVVWAKTGGDAVGILSRDGGATYAGIMLDHDLHQQLRDQGGKQLTGADVARKIAEHVSPDTLIFLHSMNPERRGDILTVLQAAGFEVTQVPMRQLDAGTLQSWLEGVVRVHEERIAEES